ncbi:hypothetical protein BGZ46_009366 [Entomortierella lignicola]|nr:hypothetical protein BGZ46_009366 [Entomortierella lignicola]
MTSLFLHVLHDVYGQKLRIADSEMLFVDENKVWEYHVIDVTRFVGFAVGVGVGVGVDVGGEDVVDREDVVAVVVDGDIDGYFESDEFVVVVVDADYDCDVMVALVAVHSDDNSDYQIEVVDDDGEYDEIELGLWDPL